jgi:hypothetical protein
MPKEKDQSLQMRSRQFAVDTIEGVGDGVGDSFLLQEDLQIKNVAAEGHNLLMLGGGNPPNEQVNFAWIKRKISRNLFANKSILVFSNLKATLDGVVIGDRDKIHPRRFGAPVQLPGIRVTVWKIEPAKDPILGAIAEF